MDRPAIHWAGIDIAKDTFQMALWGHLDFRDMRVRGFQRQWKAMKQVVAWLREEAPKGAPLGVVMEATGKLAEEVATWLRKLMPELKIAIVNPAQTAAFIKSLGFRNKTDDLDGKALARYGKDRNPVEWEPPTPEMAVLRDLVRTRADLVNARTAMINRRRDHERSSKAAADALQQVIETLATQVEALDSAILTHLKAHKDLEVQVESHMTVMGVGIVTSTTVLAEAGDLRRFDRSRKLTAFAGVSPRLKDSGKSVHGKPRMCKQGSARLRAALYMAASNAIQHNPDMKPFYEDLIKRGKAPRAALGAVMRKLLVVMRAVMVAGTEWKTQRAA